MTVHNLFTLLLYFSVTKTEGVKRWEEKRSKIVCKNYKSGFFKSLCNLTPHIFDAGLEEIIIIYKH
jgi:hypothetical protein